MLKRIHSTFYWAEDMDAAVAFYRDTLGLNLRFQAGESWAEFDVAGATFALHGTRGAQMEHGGGATVVFEVDDLEQARRLLSARGVAFEGEITEVPESGRFATFRDPAGNVVQLYEPRAEKSPTDPRRTEA